ncbi:lipocalin-like isoform X2 [Protopterus annectens]|uniref:lipocalin-like isoform X2 n=1 Tax=Protopterus annectens TaxID=7888 RepID=UPI001CFA0660|nr:lipocalin-like isoform X2 [Protopterus annectens]XP_043922592.1 lipocalin-like isoform X2 [Protopterus annectens]
MKVALAIAGLVLICSLSVFAEIPVQSNFETDRFTGKWYGIGIASDADWFQAKKNKMKMYTTAMMPTAHGGLDVTLSIQKPDGCKVIHDIYKPTGQPGHFQYTSSRWGTMHEVRVVETNYDDYILLHFQKTKGTHMSAMVKLLEECSAEI